MERSSSSFKNMCDRAREIRRRYADFERASFGRSWSPTEIALGFVGDVGDLAKLTQAHAGVRQIDDHQQKLAHELADCLWSVMTLADEFDINLEAAFHATMDELQEGLDADSREPSR